MLVITDEVPSFEKQFTDYCERQKFNPMLAAAYLISLVQEMQQVVELDAEIKGLYAVKLRTPRGGHETLLFLDHKNGSQRYSVFLSILDRPLENFVWPCKEPVCKRKLNIAIAKLIMMSKSCGGIGAWDKAV